MLHLKALLDQRWHQMTNAAPIPHLYMLLLTRPSAGNEAIGQQLGFPGDTHERT